MSTCPALGSGISRSRISKSPPGLGTCATFMGATAFVGTTSLAAINPPLFILNRGHQCLGKYRLADFLLLKRFQLGQDGGQVFRNRRMNMHSTLDDRVWSLRVHDVQQNMNNFIASCAENRGDEVI